MQNKTIDHDTDGRDGFLFVGNNLALDFLNTCPVINDEPTELISDMWALLRWFHAAGLISIQRAGELEKVWGKSNPGYRAVITLRRLRENLRKAVLAWEGGTRVERSIIRELNALMRAHPIYSRLQAGPKTLALMERFDPDQPEDLAGPIAHAAARLFAETAPKRVRKCELCILHYRDVSKKGSRRWCSMRLCGNRVKVAAYAARQSRRKRGVIKSQPK